MYLKSGSTTWIKYLRLNILKNLFIFFYYLFKYTLFLSKKQIELQYNVKSRSKKRKYRKST